MPIFKIAGFLAAAFASTAVAEVTPEYPSAAPAFLDACVSGELTAAARETAIAAGGWSEETPTVEVKNFGTSRAIDRNFDYSKPLSVRQWSRTIDGVQMRLVLASFDAKRRYPTLCALVVPNVKYGWVYRDAFEPAIKALGLKGKSTDLPHYFEYSGKVDGNRPVRAEIFGRTLAVPEKNSMHLYIAF